MQYSELSFKEFKWAEMWSFDQSHVPVEDDGKRVEMGERDKVKSERNTDCMLLATGRGVRLRNNP